MPRNSWSALHGVNPNLKICINDNLFQEEVSPEVLKLAKTFKTCVQFLRRQEVFSLGGV